MQIPMNTRWKKSDVRWQGLSWVGVFQENSRNPMETVINEMTFGKRFFEREGEAMTKTIEIKAGQKATIFSRNFSSMPSTYQFHARALDGGGLAGELEVQGSQWIFRKPPTRQPLQAQNMVDAGYWDTFFRVSVIAHRDLEISVPGPKFPFLRWLIWLGALFVIIAGVVLFILAQ